MNKIFIFAFLVCLALPVFAQNPNRPMYQALSDQMGTTLTNSNTKLDNYTQDMTNNGDTANFATYRSKFNTINKALSDSEARLDLMIRSNDRTVRIKEERDRYESLVKQLDSLKSDYDNWLKNVK